MKLKTIFYLSLVIGLIGCGLPPSKQREMTDSSFASPYLIGSLKDGRKIMRVDIKYKYDTHYIYFFENGGDEVTINHNVMRGKVTHNQVIVLLDGIPVSTNLIER